MTNVKLIVCCDSNFGIGKKNQLPWSIPEEMKLFKEKTIGNGNNCVIMGKNTFLSLPKTHKPLKERKNCVLSTDNTLKDSHKDVAFLRDLLDVVDFLYDTTFDEYWIIGGSTLYHSLYKTLPHLIDEIHISKLNQTYDCDSFFNPDIINQSYCKLISSQDHGTFTHMVFKNQKMDCL